MSEQTESPQMSEQDLKMSEQALIVYKRRLDQFDFIKNNSG